MWSRLYNAVSFGCEGITVPPLVDTGIRYPRIKRNRYFESNRDLSQRRAESVANALVTGFGIAPDRLVSFGVSHAAPVASNATAEGRSQNRRVELVRY